MNKTLVNREVIHAAIDALESVERLIEHQYTGTREGMAYLQDPVDDAQVMLGELQALLDQPDVPEVVLGLLDEIKGWKADQKENLKNQCDLQAEINRLRVALKYIADIDRYDVRKITDTLPVYVYGQAGEVAHKALGETK